MLKRIPFLILKLILFWVLFFTLARMFFFMMVFPYWVEMDWSLILLSGLKTDALIILLLGLPSSLFFLISTWKSQRWSIKVHQAYHVVLISVFSFLIIADPFWYNFWEKRLVWSDLIDLDLLHIVLSSYSGILILGVGVIYILFTFTMLYIFYNWVWINHEWIYPRPKVQWIVSVLLVMVTLVLSRLNADAIAQLFESNAKEVFIVRLSESLNPFYFFIGG